MKESAIVGGTVSMDAIVYPPCECGEAWAKHGSCGGYKPSKPVINYGTLMFRSNDWLATTLFKLEVLFRKLRLLRMRSL